MSSIGFSSAERTMKATGAVGVGGFRRTFSRDLLQPSSLAEPGESGFVVQASREVCVLAQV